MFRFINLFWNSFPGHLVLLPVWGGGAETAVWRRIVCASHLFIGLYSSGTVVCSFCVCFLLSLSRRMVLSTSQQIALAFTAVLLMFVVLPRLFGIGGGGTVSENTFDPRYSRKGKLIWITEELNDLGVIGFLPRHSSLVYDANLVHRKRLTLTFKQFFVFPRLWWKDNTWLDVGFMPHPVVFYSFDCVELLLINTLSCCFRCRFIVLFLK